MNHPEFDQQASDIAEQLPTLPERDQIAAACRGSGNPAALTWLAEALRIDAGTNVIDLGAGLGGATAWFQQHFDCQCVNLEIAASAAAASAELFATPTIIGCTEHLPIRSDAFDVALLLGVLSVVSCAEAALRETRRIARRVGVLEYCSTTGSTLALGGSEFVTANALRDQVRTTFGTVVEFAEVTLPAPRSWTAASAAIDVAPEPTERQVADAIQAGYLVPFVLHAAR